MQDTNYSLWQWESLSHHIDALLLALASSTDNFMVGLSIGLGGQPHLALWANLCISLCNAGGAWAAGRGGMCFQSYSFMDGNLPLFLSAFAFGMLALSEFQSYRNEAAQLSDAIKKNDVGAAQDTIEKSEASLSNIPSVLKLAVPMTLNNLAGGVAGGVAGLTPAMSAGYALLASFTTMLVGHQLGYRLEQKMSKEKVNSKNTSSQPWIKRFHPSLLAAFLLGTLSFMTFHEAVFG